MKTLPAQSYRILIGVTAAWLLAAIVPAAHAQTNLIPPQIQNLASVQRAGTFFVDVTYDLVDPDSQRLMIQVEASSNGGGTYLVPMTSLEGDAGLVAPGLGKKIVWNAWNDWAGNYTTNAKVRLIADDTMSASPPPTNSVPSNLVWLNSGSFNMSGTLVYLTKGFYMAKWEVTQTEYINVMSNNPSSFTGSGTRPVDSVTWFEATNYCARLTARELAAGRLPAGWVYRLPTEAEWEFACRAGTTTTYYFSDSAVNLSAYAWSSNNGLSMTHDVGLKGPNRRGLYDMYGNVAEWCSDWAGSLPVGNVTDPQGPASGSYRVVRGGSWIGGSSGACTSAYRFSNDPSIRYIYSGFRVVLAPGQ